MKLQQLIYSVLSIFRKKQLRIGLYGPPNGGKTTLANRICGDWMGEKMGKVSSIAHETRHIQSREAITVKTKKRSITFNLVDTPGIATRIDTKDFIKAGLSAKKARQRAFEATKGVVESIRWLDNVDVVLVVLDATRDPLEQVNLTIIGNLEARNIPIVIVANKVDLRKAKPQRIKDAFHKYPVIAISAKLGKNVDKLYEEMVKW